MGLAGRIDSWDRGGAWPAAAVSAGFALFLFVATACPTVPFGDGGELIAAASCLGVAHPPGYPLYTTLGRLALAVPLGEPAWRMNLLSGLFGALACGAAAWLLGRGTGSRIAAISGGLALAASSTFWSVATVAEVYTLHLFLMLVLLGAALALGDPAATPRGRTGAALIGAAALGLGLAHHPTIVLALPAAAVLAARGRSSTARRRRGRLAAVLPELRPSVAAACALLVVAFPAIFYGWLMLRARHEPLADWGRPVDLPSLWAHATAVSYRHLDLGWAGLLRPAAWRELTGLLLDELTPLALPLIAVGLVGPLLATRRAADRSRHLAIGAALLMLCGTVFGLRYTAEDIQPFYLPLFVGMALATGLGVAVLRTGPTRSLRLAGLAAAALVVVAPLATHLRARDLSGMTAAADYGRDILGTLPDDAPLFVESDDAFPLAYLTQVLGERPDVRIFHREGFLFADLARTMHLAARPGESVRDDRIRAERIFINRELSRDGSPGVWFLGWPGYEVPRRYRLEPVGLLYRVVDAVSPTADDDAVRAGYHEAGVLAQAERSGDGFALTAAATYPLSRGERKLFLGDREAARREFDKAARIGRFQAALQNYIGTLYGRIGDYDEAIAAFRRALAAKPTELRAWNNLALACGYAGDVDCARDAWRRSLELVPGQPEALNGLRSLDAGTSRP